MTTQFKVGDRVRYTSGKYTWTAYVSRAEPGKIWVRDRTDKLPNDNPDCEFEYWDIDDEYADAFTPAPRYEQCGCATSGALGTWDKRPLLYGVTCELHCHADHDAEAHAAYSAIESGLRALHAATNPAPISSEPATAESDAARDVVQGKAPLCDGDCEYEYCTAHERKAPLASDAQTERECRLKPGDRVRYKPRRSLRGTVLALVGQSLVRVHWDGCVPPAFAIDRDDVELASESDHPHTAPAAPAAPVCDDCGKGPAELRDAYRDGEMGPERAKRVLCVYCGDRLDPKKYFKRDEGGPGITPPPPPVVDEDGEVWATASGEWP